MKLKQQTILTNDPSMTAWGWAVLDWDGKVIDSGCIKTAPDYKKKRIRKGDDTVRRVSEINHQLLRTIRRHNVVYVLSELPHGSQNANAAIMIGIVTGILQTICDVKKLGIEWYSEGDAKKHLLGKLSAAKREVIDAIAALYHVPWRNIKYIDEAVADAMAIYHVAQFQSSTLKLMKQKEE
jgi:Holliday junction resolvasome RuvABC endonuclease subunit